MNSLGIIYFLYIFVKESKLFLTLAIFLTWKHALISEDNCIVALKIVFLSNIKETKCYKVHKSKEEYTNFVKKKY